MRTYNNLKNDGHIISIDLIDHEGTLIQAKMFNEEALKWTKVVEENKVYVFSGCIVKMANKKFTSIKNNFCITFDRSTNIQECMDDNQINQTGFSLRN